MVNEFKEIIVYRLKKMRLIQKYFRSPETGNTYGTLSPNELRYIIAFAEVIYHCSSIQERNKLHAIVRDWTNVRTQTDGYLKVFRQGINTITLLTARNDFDKPFYELSITERIKILGHPKYTRLDMYDSPGLGNPFTVLKFVLNRIINHKQDRKFFFLGTLRKDLIRGIFNSELGWTFVGYTSWPGIEGKELNHTKNPQPIRETVYEV